MKNLAVLVSGQGSILEAMIQAGLPIGVVIADRECRALDIAREAGIDAILTSRSAYGHPNKDWDRTGYTFMILNILKYRQIKLAAMAGFMTILGRDIEGSVTFLNTHPSLLPQFRGDHAVADALAAGARETGCTIHVATAELDAGPILAQQKVPIKKGDTLETLHERIKQVERKLYPQVIKDILEGRIKL